MSYGSKTVDIAAPTSGGIFMGNICFLLLPLSVHFSTMVLMLPLLVPKNISFIQVPIDIMVAVQLPILQRMMVA